MRADDDVDKRLDRMIELADETGQTLDDIVKAIGRAPQSLFDAVSDKPSLLPLYIQSSDKP